MVKIKLKSDRRPRCSVCKNYLQDMELSHYKRTKIRICLDCEAKDLDDVRGYLEDFGKELEDYESQN